MYLLRVEKNGTVAYYGPFPAEKKAVEYGKQFDTDEYRLTYPPLIVPLRN